LIVCLFIGFMYWESVWQPYFNPTLPPRAAAPVEQAPAAKAPAQPTGTEFIEQSAQPAPSGTAAAAIPGQYPADARINQQGFVEVVTDTLTIQVSLLGGRFTDVLLNKFPAQPEEGSPPL